MNKAINYLKDGNVQVSILIILLVFYIITKSAIFGVIILLSMILFLLIEFYVGSKSHGIKKEVVETIIAFLVAFLLWRGLIFLLHTTSPLSAVVSCSMADYINRGDMIIVEGSEDYYAPYTLQVSKEDIENLDKNEAIVEHQGREYSIKGSIFSSCQNSYSKICRDFEKNPTEFLEKRGNFKFEYSSCTRSNGKIRIEEPCLTGIEYKGKEYKIKKTGDVVIYTPKKQDLFYTILLGGDIIHRAIFKLKEGNNTYYITKGDNNNIADFQFYSNTYGRKNSVVEKEQIKGKMISKIPFLGYYKLFLVGSFEEGKLCSFILRE